MAFFNDWEQLMALILNNYCERQNEDISEQMVQHTRAQNNMDEPRIDRNRGINSAEEAIAKRIRNIFVKYFD